MVVGGEECGAEGELRDGQVWVLWFADMMLSKVSQITFKYKCC